jgi:hypothetical protein
VGQGLISFDTALGGPLPEWCRAAALVVLAAGGIVAFWCIGVPKPDTPSRS